MRVLTELILMLRQQRSALAAATLPVPRCVVQATLRTAAAEQEVAALQQQASRARQAPRVDIALALPGNMLSSEAGPELDTCFAGRRGGECVS